MGHHYIPRRLLKGFANNGAVWTFDKRSLKEPMSLTLAAVANEKRMYPDQLEDRLNNEFEQPFNSVLERLEAGEMLTEEDKSAIGRYALTMYRRGPGARARSRDAIPSVAALVAQQQYERLRSQHGFSAPSPTPTAHLRERARQIEQAIRAEGTDSLWYSTMVPEGLPNVDRALQTMQWAVWKSPPGQQFIVGDCPVVFPEELGLADSRSTVLLPISHDLALLGSWISTSVGVRRTFSWQQVRALNIRQVQQAHRWVFFKEFEAWVFNFLRKQTRQQNK